MSSGGGGDNTIKFPKYLEEIHKDYLEHDGRDWPDLSVTDIFNAALNQSPYDSYVPLVVEDAFFGDGYRIENFPTLYDMFGKFMASLDVCDLYGQIYENVVHGPEIENSVKTHSDMLQDEIDTKVMPRFLAGMRDINSVMSSSFIIGKAIIADSKVKAVSQFGAELRYRAIDAAAKLWVQHLDWNKSVIQLYAEYAKLYYSTKSETDKLVLEYKAKDVLWNANLLDYVRAMLGALNGAPAAKSDKEPNQLAGAIGGGLSGAVTGFGAAGPIGAVIGAGLGIAGSFF